jgi:Domain of unknown function (DUF1707)
MTDQLPGRTPPWGLGVWALPARPQGQPVRIGDAERDEALDKLGDHFAAGRLTREEFDERSGTAMVARFDSDLEPIFRDLPDASRHAVERRTHPQRQAGLPAAVVVLVPLLVLAVFASIILHGPVLVAPLLWLLVLSGMGRRHHYR